MRRKSLDEVQHVTVTLSDLSSHVNTINLQVEVTNFIHKCLVEGTSASSLRSNDDARLPTLFGNGHARAELAIQVWKLLFLYSIFGIFLFYTHWKRERRDTNIFAVVFILWRQYLHWWRHKLNDDHVFTCCAVCCARTGLSVWVAIGCFYIELLTSLLTSRLINDIIIQFPAVFKFLHHFLLYPTCFSLIS